MHVPSRAPAKMADVPLPIADLSNDLMHECWKAYIAMLLNSSGSIVFTVSATGFAIYDNAGRGFGEENFGLHRAMLKLVQTGPKRPDFLAFRVML